MSRILIRIYLNSDGIKELLARRNLSLKDMAERLDMNYHHLSNLLSERRSPAPETRARIQKFFQNAAWSTLFYYPGEVRREESATAGRI